MYRVTFTIWAKRVVLPCLVKQEGFGRIRDSYDCVSDLQNFREVSQPPECLDEAM